MVDFKLCLFINQHLTQRNIKTRVLNSWKSKKVYHSKLIALKNDFLPNIKYFEKNNLITI